MSTSHPTLILVLELASSLMFIMFVFGVTINVAAYLGADPERVFSWQKKK